MYLPYLALPTIGYISFGDDREGNSELLPAPYPYFHTSTSAIMALSTADSMNDGSLLLHKYSSLSHRRLRNTSTQQDLQ